MMTLNPLNKIGRNDLCSCGSGKKYKKCCLEKEGRSHLKLVSVNDPSPKLKTNKVTLMTTTNECQMPVRLYYTINDKEALIEKLKKLKCISWDDDSHFSIDYYKEAEEIGLSVKHNEVPKELYPIILARGTIVNNKELHMDLRAFLRAIGIVKFINAHIDKSIIRLRHVASCNFIKGITSEEAKKPISIDFDNIFSEKNMVIFDHKGKKKEFEKLIETTQNAHGTEEKNKIARDFFEKMEQVKVPPIEKFPVSQYKNGLKQLEFSLRLKMIHAFDQYSGDKDATLMSTIRKMVERNPL